MEHPGVWVPDVSGQLRKLLLPVNRMCKYDLMLIKT